MTAYMESLIVFGAVYAIMASAVHVPLIAGQLFFPQIGLMLIGAYGSAALVGEGVPWIVAGLVSVAVASVLAVVIGLLGLRLKGFPLAIATIAVAEGLRLTITSTGILGGVAGFSGIPKASTWQIAVLILALTLVVLGYFHSSFASRQAIAFGNEEVAARSFGVSPARTKALIYLLCGLLCGVGGALYASYVRFLEPDYFGFSTLVLILVFTVVGGARNMFGPVLGVALLWLLPEYMSFLAEYRLIAYSIVVIAIIAIQPDGITGMLAKLARVAGRGFGDPKSGSRGIGRRRSPSAAD